MRKRAKETRRDAAEAKGLQGDSGQVGSSAWDRRVRRVQKAKGRENSKRSARLAFTAAENGFSLLDDHQLKAVPWTPHGYQLRATEFLLGQDAAGLFLDPGLGKTSIVLAALKALKDAGKLKRALIIAPLRVCHMTWPAELAKWQDFSDLSMTVLHGHKKDRLVEENTDIHVINPEGLKWLWPKLKNKWPYQVLVIDESTKFKSWSAQRTKSLRPYLEKFDYRWILTGTPAPNGIQDLFSQVFILDGGERLGRYITHFRTRFMIQGGYQGYEWMPKKDALEEIEALLEDIVLRLEAADWLELPKLSFVDILVELPKAARQQYNELEEEFILQLESSEVSAMHAASLGMKLRQVTNGCVYDDDGKPHVVHTEKLDALQDLVEELSGQPVLVAVAFRSEVDLIRERLGPTPYLGGGVTKKEAADIERRWNKGEIPVLLAHPASVSHGLNLQGACRHICWYGLTWNLEEHEQLIKRIYRQGQKASRVIVHNIVVKRSKDQDIARALRSKDATQGHLLRALKKRTANVK